MRIFHNDVYKLIFSPVLIATLIATTPNLHAASLRQQQNEAIQCGLDSQNENRRVRAVKGKLVKKIIRDLDVVNNAMACQKQFGDYDRLIKKHSLLLLKNQTKLKSSKSKLCKFHRRIAKMRPAPTKRLMGFVKELSKSEGRKLCRSWIAYARRR